VFGDLKDDNGSNTGINFDDDDKDMPNDIYVDLDVPTYLDEVYFIDFFVSWLLCLAIYLTFG
jgi:condensin-2 complex subunit H2